MEDVNYYKVNDSLNLYMITTDVVQNVRYIMGEQHIYVHVVSVQPAANLTVLKIEQDILIRLYV